MRCETVPDSYSEEIIIKTDILKLPYIRKTKMLPFFYADSLYRYEESLFKSEKNLDLSLHSSLMGFHGRTTTIFIEILFKVICLLRKKRKKTSFHKRVFTRPLANPF